MESKCTPIVPQADVQDRLYPLVSSETAKGVGFDHLEGIGGYCGWVDPNDALYVGWNTEFLPVITSASAKHLWNRAMGFLATIKKNGGNVNQMKEGDTLFFKLDRGSSKTLIVRKVSGKVKVVGISETIKRGVREVTTDRYTINGVAMLMEVTLEDGLAIQTVKKDFGKRMIYTFLHDANGNRPETPTSQEGF